MTTVALWLGVIATIAMYSYLWKDNKLFKLGEHIFVALAAAHSMVMGYNNVVEVAWKPMVQKDSWWMIIPLVLGLMLYTRYWRNLAVWSRFPIAFMFGTGAAVTIRGEISANLLMQIRSTMMPLNSFDNIVFVVGVVTTLAYFLFIASLRNKAIDQAAYVGRWMMMVSFGAVFGNTIMARVSLVIGRLEFLFGRWIPIIKL